MWPDRIPHHSHIYTFRCHPLGLLSPTCHPTSRPQMQAGHLQEALPDSCPSHPPHPRKAVVSWSPRQGTPWEKYYPGSGGGGVCDTDTTAASVGTRIPITGPRPGYEASSGSRGWAPGAEAAAGGDRDCAEGPSPALQASTFIGLLTEAVLWAAACSTCRYGGRRGRGKRNIDEGRIGNQRNF